MTKFKKLTLLIVISLFAGLYGAGVFWFNQKAPAIIKAHEQFFGSDEDNAKVNPWLFRICFYDENDEKMAVGSPSLNWGAFTIHHYKLGPLRDLKFTVTNLGSFLPTITLTQDVNLRENISKDSRLYKELEQIGNWTILKGSNLTNKMLDDNAARPLLTLKYKTETPSIYSSSEIYGGEISLTSKITDIQKINFFEIIKNAEFKFSLTDVESAVFSNTPQSLLIDLEKTQANFITNIKNAALLKEKLTAENLFKAMEKDSVPVIPAERETITRMVAVFQMLISDIKDDDAVGFNLNINYPGLKETLIPRTINTKGTFKFGKINADLYGAIHMTGYSFDKMDLRLNLRHPFDLVTLLQDQPESVQEPANALKTFVNDAQKNDELVLHFTTKDEKTLINGEPISSILYHIEKLLKASKKEGEKEQKDIAA